MGGGAFQQATASGEPTLQTPRMTHEQFDKLKSLYLERLRTLFPARQVACLISAPEKKDHGDVDIIISTVTTDAAVDLVWLAVELGARGLIRSSANRCTMAVPVDGQEPRHALVQYQSTSTAKSRSPSPPAADSSTQAPASHEDQIYAQVDLEFIPSQRFGWFTFYASYGDVAAMLGYILRKDGMGFTINDAGLWLRLPELDSTKDLSYVQNLAERDGMIHLSSSPEAVMKFMGLDVEVYEQGFSTLDELYTWVATSRFIDLPRSRKSDDRDQHEDDGLGHLSEYKAKQKRNRPVFMRFVKDWLPQHARTPAVSMSSSGEQTEVPEVVTSNLRKCLANEAISHFDVADEYHAKREAIRRHVGNATAIHLLRPIITKHTQRSSKQQVEIVRAFRRWVGVDPVTRAISILDTAHEDSEAQLLRLLADDLKALYDEPAVDAWIKERWEEVRRQEREKKKK